MLSPEEYIALYEKYQAGKCSPEERRALYAFQDQFKLASTDDEPRLDEMQASQRAYRQIEEEFNQKHRMASNAKWIAAAAAIILAVGFWAILSTRLESSSIPTQAMAQQMQPIKPGKNTATLTLADGSSILLDDAQVGEVAEEAGVGISKTADGQLVYTVQAEVGAKEPSYQTMETPKGGQYQLILPDSTKVWLNAESSLRYPVNFIGDERVVELSGEAYFEVTKRVNQPFKVKTLSQQVEVLGTAFNISAYPNDPVTTTTVASGSVNVRSAAHAHISQVLKAGDQSELQEGTSAMKLTRANLRQSLSWKNGYFIFENDPLAEIMAKIARWYDIEVVYAGAVQQQKFGGSYNRNKDFMELLKGLELTGNVHFKIEGRRVTVMP